MTDLMPRPPPLVLVIYEGGGGDGDHLVASGFRVEEAQSGAEGVDRAAALLPDLVVLDFDLDGETVAQIRQGPSTKDIPIIARRSRKRP